MGIFSSGADSARKARQLLAATAKQNRGLISGAGEFAEQQLSPYMLSGDYVGELEGIISGDRDYRASPLYERYMDVGRETMMEDMAGTGSLYSGTRMEGMRDLGQNAFSNYMSALSGLAGFGRDTASQMANIRMGTNQQLAGINQGLASDTANIRMAQSANERSLGMGLLDFGSQMAKAAATAGAGGGA